MAAPLASTYITLGSLAMRSQALIAYDWSDLLKDAPKDGQNRKLPGLHGTEPRPRTRGEVRAALLVRINGAYTTANAPIASEADRIAQVYTLLQTLRARTTLTTVQTITLTTPTAAWSAGCQVEDGGTPRFVTPWIVELAVDVTLPAGALL